MKYEVRKINWMGETVDTIEVDDKRKANDIATAWLMDKGTYEGVRIYEIHDKFKVRVY